MIEKQNLSNLKKDELIKLLVDVERDLTDSLTDLEIGRDEDREIHYKYGYLSATVSRNIAIIRGRQNYYSSDDLNFSKIIGVCSAARYVGKEWGSLTSREKEHFLSIARSVNGIDGTTVVEGGCIVDFEGYDFSICGAVVEGEILINDIDVFYNPMV